jgi:hypothetical protein
MHVCMYVCMSICGDVVSQLSQSSSVATMHDDCELTVVGGLILPRAATSLTSCWMLPVLSSRKFVTLAPNFMSRFSIRTV